MGGGAGFGFLVILGIVVRAVLIVGKERMLLSRRTAIAIFLIIRKSHLF